MGGERCEGKKEVAAGGRVVLKTGGETTGRAHPGVQRCRRAAATEMHRASGAWGGEVTGTGSLQSLVSWR
jgi:hypothetical protein